MVIKTRGRHRFHGDATRFDVLAAFIYDRYGHSVEYIADVAGGQGMLARILNKKYNYTCEVIDPRGWVLKGVPSRTQEFDPALASYYDLVVGLHPDEALRATAQAALIRPTILIPCCNFWSTDALYPPDAVHPGDASSHDKLGRDALLCAIEQYYLEHGVSFERIAFDFRGPKNIGLVSRPPN